MAYSEAQKRATLKYSKNNYYMYQVKFPKDMEKTLKKAGKDSINKLITEAVYDKLRSMGYDVES